MKKTLWLALLLATSLINVQAQFNFLNGKWVVRTAPGASTYMDLRPVTTVFGRTGDIAATAADITETSDRFWFKVTDRNKLLSIPNFTSFGEGFGVVNGVVSFTGTTGGGGGDMFKSVYDTNNDGIVDLTANANALGGVLATSYVQKDGSKVLSDQNYTTPEKAKVANLSGTNTGDQQLTFANNQILLSGNGSSGGAGTVSLPNVTVNDVFTAIRNFPDFAPNSVLTTDVNSAFRWVPKTSFGTSTTTTTPTNPTTTTGSSYTFVQADSTISRVNRSQMSDINITDDNTLRTYLASDLTNRRLVLANGIYPGYHEQTGNWTNVEVYNPNRGAIIQVSNGTTAWLFQGSAIRNRIAINGIKFESTWTGNEGYPVFWWNELPNLDGLEVLNCELTSPNNQANLMGCVQYSTSSNSGNIAKNIFIHHNYLHDGGRMGGEFLSQGYDNPRLFNFVLTNNRFINLGINNEFGMAVSWSGLIRQMYVGNNYIQDTRKVAIEFVNTQDVLARNNRIISTGSKGTVGYGISDDSQHTTRNIYIEAGVSGDINVTERPFYVYGSSNVNFKGRGKDGVLWKGGRGIQMNGSYCRFDSLNILIQTKPTNFVEASWEITSGNNFVVNNSKISSAGSVAAGANPAFESMVWREGVTNTASDNCTTIVGLQANGQPYASPENGGDGRIVNKGSGNTITNNIKSTAP